MIDIHSHAIFEVDDGAPSIKESIRMVLEAESIGVKAIVLTPHFHIGLFNIEKVEENYYELKQRVSDCGVDLYLGYEVFIDSLLSGQGKSDEKLRLNDSPYLLLELPFDIVPSYYPRSPYAAAKLYSYWLTVNYREAYNLFTCNGILFNHESPRRGETFVTRKITKAVANIKAGKQDKLTLGNIDAKRDWGYAGDYVEGMWLMLQQEKPDDYVLATGESHSVREFVEEAFKEAGVHIKWEGEGIEEKGLNAENGQILVDISPKYFRPTEVEFLEGDPTKAEKQIGWKRKVSFKELVQMMVQADMLGV